MTKISLYCRVLTVMLLFATFSCKKNYLNNPDSPQTVAKIVDSNAVSMSIAGVAAVQNGNIVSQENQKKTNSNSPFQSKQILDSLAVPDNVNPSYYIFNYVGGGYSIVSADNRIQPILAYNDKGHFENSPQLHPGLINWLSVTHKNIQLIKKDRIYKAPKKVTKLWASLATANYVGQHKLTVNNVPPEECHEYNYSNTVGPLLSTAWGQGYPFNVFCPSGSYELGHTPTGCVATAIAQIMRYWQYPTTYSWSTMPADKYGSYSSSLAQLMVDIGNDAGMNWDDSGSSVSGNPEAGVFKNSRFGYSTATLASFNYINVVSNLNGGMPVLVSATYNNPFFGIATGHEWVCDGYTDLVWNYCDVDGNAYGGEFMYLHMNWGWNGTANDYAYYGLVNWTPNGDPTNYHFYQYNQKMIYNIHP
ncbi:C10 family peptidase [Mucilaginibacter sp. UYCu711]|uniref:C10 family peptidase n=1 Tax=Mucilaginibacter sp. UYCu711 TaxID=3156339 RepID=UPI003D196570